LYGLHVKWTELYLTWDKVMMVAQLTQNGQDTDMTYFSVIS